MVFEDAREPCTSAGRQQPWLLGATSLVNLDGTLTPLLMHRCPECGWYEEAPDAGGIELPPHRRADQCPEHGCYLSNGAGTPCDWCMEDAMHAAGYEDPEEWRDAGSPGY